MADLKVRQLDERVARALKSRAARRGVSLEEEVRSTLGAAVAARRDAFRRRARALRASTAGRSSAAADSANTIRRERDANG
jgi:plasmid stability protein